MKIILLAIALILLDIVVNLAILTLILGRVRMKALLRDFAVRHGLRPFDTSEIWPEEMPPVWNDDLSEDECDPYAEAYDDSDYHLENSGC